MFANHHTRHIGPHVKWAVSLLIADGHFNLHQWFAMVWFVWINILTLLPLREASFRKEIDQNVT